jgi:hypothetical protein
MLENLHILMRLSAREGFIESCGHESYQDYTFVKCWKFVTSVRASTHTRTQRARARAHTHKHTACWWIIRLQVIGKGKWAAFPLPTKTCLLPTTADSPKVVTNTTDWGRTPLTEASFLKWWRTNCVFQRNNSEFFLCQQFSVSTMPAEQYLTRTRGCQTEAKQSQDCRSYTNLPLSNPWKEVCSFWH